MAEVECKFCHKNEGFYRNVTVEGGAWVDAEIVGHDDGSVSGTTDDYAQDKQVEITYHDEWGCVNCNAERHKLEELVQVAEDEEIDPLARAQKFPIPGQEAMSV